MKGKGFVNFLSYIAIAFVAVALVLAKIFDTFQLSSNLIFAFYYAKSRKSIGWMIAYVVFVIIIVVFLVLNFNI